MQLKLSEAIDLGRSLIRHGNGFLTLINGEGCACGMALAAVGETFGTADLLQKHWPWADYEVWLAISCKYWEVCYGTLTLDELIDWVRANEPAAELPFEDTTTLGTTTQKEVKTTCEHSELASALP